MSLFPVKALAYLSALAYAFEIGALDPAVSEVLNPRWHAVAPMRIALRHLSELFPMVNRRYGERGTRALNFIIYQIGRDRAPILQKALDIDPWDARSIGRIFDLDDSLMGADGDWPMENVGLAVKRETYCLAARELERCPQLCTSPMMALESGTISAINPDAYPPRISEFLTGGDGYCLMEIELPVEVLGRAAYRERSIFASGGPTEPMIMTPALLSRLLVSAVTSVGKSIIKLLVAGVEQEMYWYDSFRWIGGR